MKKIFIDDGRYEVGCGFGAWAVSHERRAIDKGTVRLIGGLTMAAYNVYREGFFNFKVTWTPTDDKQNSAEHLRAWVSGL